MDQIRKIPLFLTTVALAAAASFGAIDVAACAGLQNYDQVFTNRSPEERRLIVQESKRWQVVADAINADRDRYYRELGAINVLEVLAPAFRKRDLDGALTRSRLAQARAILARQRRERADRDVQMRDAIRQSRLPEHLKSYYISVVDRTLRDNLPTRERIFDSSDKSIDAVERVVLILQGHRWEYANGVYQFEDPEVIAAFNTEMVLLQKLDAETQNLVRKLQDQMPR